MSELDTARSRWRLPTLARTNSYIFSSHFDICSVSIGDPDWICEAVLPPPERLVFQPQVNFIIKASADRDGSLLQRHYCQV